MDATDGPLSDLTVVELGNIIAAPFAAMALADLGAEVIKVERPGTGDLVREHDGPGAAIFATLNRNKRSVELDLGTDAGRELYLDLAAEADVVVENLGPGSADRLGIGYDDLRERNPGLIYLSIKGFLEDGPYGDRPGMDVVAQSMSGLMRMTGRPGDAPTRAGTSVADFAAGLYGLVATLVALRERDRTGEGRRVDAGLFESAAHLTGYWTTYAELSGVEHPPLGSSHPAFSLYDAFRTADDEWAFVGVVSPGHWPAFCRATGLERLATDERFDTPEKRRANKGELTDVVRGELRSWERDELVDALLAEDVPAAPINHPADLADDPHLEAVGLLGDVGRDGESARTPLTPIVGDGIHPEERRGPPSIGEHTEEVLSERGLDGDDIDRYRERGAFGGG